MAREKPIKKYQPYLSKLAPDRITRRQFVGVAGAGLAAGMAGPGKLFADAKPAAAGSGPLLTLEEQLRGLEDNPRIKSIREAREGLAQDPYRPLYHFSTPGGAMNDPNGVCQWHGKYHLFYQWFPHGSKVVHWGHAYSEDLLNWVDLPEAISPTIEQQCYSGQTLVEDDRVIAMYHGTRVGNMIATASDPLLLNWDKHPDNPVIPIVPVDGNGKPYRVFDPEIWKEGDTYYALSGTYQNGARGRNAEMVAQLFKSDDLATWTHEGALIEGTEWTDPGEDCAVPNFLPIGNGKHILMFFSHKRAGQYLIGDYDRDNHRFNPDQHGRFSFGTYLRGTLHAPSAFINDDGDLIAYFNMREAQTTVRSVITEHRPGAWYGILNLPRRYWLDEMEKLCVEPAPDTSSLRSNHHRITELAIAGDSQVVLDEVHGKALELDAVFDTDKASEVGVHVLRSPDGTEQTTVRLEIAPNEEGGSRIGIDVTHATEHEDVAVSEPAMAPIDLPAGERVRLRIFVDRSIVEVFANQTQCVSLRTYPKRADSRGVSVYAKGGDASLVSLDSWQMRSVWPELEFREMQ